MNSSPLRTVNVLARRFTVRFALTGLVAGAFVFGLTNPAVYAAPQYATGSFTWNNGAAPWSTVPGGPYTGTWTGFNEAFFEGTAGTVTVGAASANALTFNSNGYVLNGGTITKGSPATGTIFNVPTAGHTATINSTITSTSLGFLKQGAGTLELGGNVTYNGSGGNVEGNFLRIDNGTLRVTGGTQSNNTFFILGRAADATPQAFEQTGGTFTQSSTLYISNAGTGSSTLSFSGGTFNATGQVVAFAERAAATMNVSGTADVRFGTVTANGVSTVTRVAEINLNGGSLTATSFSNAGSDGSTFIFNFNGGTLKPTTTNTFINANTTRANVRNGGAIFDVGAGIISTIAEPLEHSNIGGDNATDGGLTKLGTGTLTLTAANTYTGTTTVSGGTLTLTGAGTISNTLSMIGGSTFDLTAKSGALSLANLLGTGTIQAGANLVTVDTALTPGSSPGTLSLTGDLDVLSSALLTWELDAADQSVGGANDLLAVTGNLTLGGTLDVNAIGSFTGVTSGTWTIATYSGTLVDNGLTLGSLPALDANYQWSLNTGSGTNDAVTLSIAAIPEPSTLVLGGLALLGFAGAGLRRRRRTT